MQSAASAPCVIFGQRHRLLRGVRSDNQDVIWCSICGAFAQHRVAVSALVKDCLGETWLTLSAQAQGALTQLKAGRNPVTRLPFDFVTMFSRP